MEDVTQDWERFKTVARDAGDVTLDGDDLALTVIVDLAGDATCEVAAILADAGGRRWIVLTAEVAAAGEVDPMEALAHNSTLAVGALCSSDGVILMKHVTPANDEESASTLQLVAAEAVRLRDLVSARQAQRTVHLFSNYVE